MKIRTEILGTGDEVQLKAQFFDDFASPLDLDAFPQIQITSPSTGIYLPYTSAGVYRIGVGLYAYNFAVPISGPVGVWVDSWSGVSGAENLINNFSFIVSNTTLAQPHLDGYEQLGDLPIEELSQDAIHNINILMRMLGVRLKNYGRRETKDAYGNTVYENCNIFDTEELKTFLCISLAEFNNTPHTTFFTFENPIVLDYRDVIVDGAYIMALASQALIEKGKEFTISDNGISYQVPLIADFLNSQMSALVGPYKDRLKFIKHQFKTIAGLGTLRVTAVAPQLMRLRHLRSRQYLI